MVLQIKKKSSKLSVADKKTEAAHQLNPIQNKGPN